MNYELYTGITKITNKIVQNNLRHKPYFSLLGIDHTICANIFWEPQAQLNNMRSYKMIILKKSLYSSAKLKSSTFEAIDNRAAMAITSSFVVVVASASILEFRIKSVNKVVG